MSSNEYVQQARDDAGASPAYSELARKLREEGGRTLSDREVLAILLARGRGRAAYPAAQRVLGKGNLAGLGARESGLETWFGDVPDLLAERLAAALEIARRLGPAEGDARLVVRTPRDVFEVAGDIRSARREHFLGLYLNTRNRLLARETVSLGSLNASIVHPREVFEPAVRLGAASLVVVHNHPSGETDPSEDDLGITRRLAEAGDILGIGLLDHVIVGARGYTSLKEEGHL